MTKARTTNPRFSTAFRKSPLIERFHKSYTKTENGCWEWFGTHARKGWEYGVLRENKHEKLAHRVSWEFYNGPIPEGIFVCHKCDNPRCVNPEHLFLGTGIDNMKDRESKGRGPQGERNWCTKLKEVDIPIIKQLYKEGWTQGDLAKRFVVNQGTISNVVNNQTWQHLTKENKRG